MSTQPKDTKLRKFCDVVYARHGPQMAVKVGVIIGTKVTKTYPSGTESAEIEYLVEWRGHPEGCDWVWGERVYSTPNEAFDFDVTNPRAAGQAGAR